MVNTRRMDSGQSSSRPHRTRNSIKLEQNSESDASSAKEDEEIDTEISNSDDNDDDDEDDDDNDNNTPSDSPLIKLRSQQQKKKIEQSNKVSAHKSDYKRKFNDYSLKSDHKSLSLGRSNLAVYAKRKMDSSMEMDNHDYLDADYYLRSSKSSRLKKSRILRRTALSLRPISQKCYIDRFPIHFDSDSDASLVKRRTRQKNISWLADSQMHTAGYPNLFNGYSEEDSRDAVEHENVEMQPIRRTKRRSVKPTYYYDEYEESNDISKNGRTSKRETRSKTSNGSIDKTVKDDGIQSRTRNKRNETVDEKNGDEKIENNVNGEDNSSKENDEQKNNNTGENDKNVLSQKQSNSSSDSNDDDHKPLQSRIDRSTAIRMRTIRKKMVDSSSESEEEGGRTYLLRNRQKKPVSPIAAHLRSERCERRNRRYPRRRVRAKSSGSDSSSSSDRCGKTSKSQSKNEKMKSDGGRNAIAPIKPECIDQSVRFASIGGLDTHIQCLKDIILLPMMYPEVFEKFKIRPPRGVLFHGPPGTGKTLISRALANECSFGKRKVSFFMRKGADLLSKWIGESEKQLHLLFKQATTMKPSIIFFDELDGLAPVRSARQDQVHASIVSTLLALMDGLDDRGEVIVIGATNRVDAIDPALRRPGRFDRELYFPLPSKSEREEILKVHVSSWLPSPTTDLITYLSESTNGYCGSDIRALCSEAVINSFRRTYPQIYNSEHKLLLDPEQVKVEKVDFMQAKSTIVPASQRVVSGTGKKLISILEPLLNSTMTEALNVLRPIFPHGFNPALSKVRLSANIRHAQLIITGDGPDHGQTNHIAPAILFKMEHIQAYVIDLTTLHKDPGRAPEEACIQVINEAKRNIPSIIYIPNIDGLWQLISETLRAIFISQINSIDPNNPILFLATAHVSYCVLPEELQKLFSSYRKEIMEIHPPDHESRYAFFKPLIINSSMQPPRLNRERPATPPSLPKAPTPPPARLTEEELEKLYHAEEHTLRELRIFLRDMCKKLANNKLFFMFTKPVDTDEVPDYTEIIKQPMDLETMMTKVDHHLYECAKDFLTDIDLICRNALEYNPAKSSADKQIRHRACSLRDYAYTLIKTEMDSDFEDKCQDIKVKRKDRNACISKYLPAYIHTPDVTNINLSRTESESVANVSIETEKSKPNEKPVETNKINSNRKRRMGWQRGYIKKRKKAKYESSTTTSSNKTKGNNSSDESKENDPDSNSNLDVQNQSIQQCESDKSIATEISMVPLSVNCDVQKNEVLPNGNMKISPKKRPTDLMSPSELLDSPLYFDDIDKALNENAVGNEDQITKVECSETELEQVLKKTVTYTDGFSLLNLLDLYNQLNNIIRNHSKNYIRHSLPQELSEELQRFKESVVNN